MGGLVSTIGNWIKAGFDLAVSSLKWIWESVKFLFGKVSALIGNVLASFSYTRERTWVQNGTTRVEVGSDRLTVSIGAEGNNQRAGQKARKEMKEKVELAEKICDDLKEYCKELKEVMEQDEQHNNQQETARKLQNLENRKCTKNIRAALDNQPSVPPGLA